MHLQLQALFVLGRDKICAVEILVRQCLNKVVFACEWASGIIGRGLDPWMLTLVGGGWWIAAGGLM